MFFSISPELVLVDEQWKTCKIARLVQLQSIFLRPLIMTISSISSHGTAFSPFVELSSLVVFPPSVVLCVIFGGYKINPFENISSLLLLFFSFLHP